MVPRNDIGKETITVTFGNGASGEYPLAPVQVVFDGEQYRVKAAVVGLPEDVLLGRDVPLHKHMVRRLPKEEQMELLHQVANEHEVRIQEKTEDESTLAVMTRAQKQKRDQQQAETRTLEEATPRAPNEESGETKPGEREVTEELLGEEFPFDDQLFKPPTKTKSYKSRAQKREHNLQWSRMKDVSNSTQLKTEQEKDPEIQKWIKQEDPTRIVRKAGVICRTWTPRNSPATTYEQIVLPKSFRNNVIKLAHDLPFAGHLGRENHTENSQEILLANIVP